MATGIEKRHSRTCRLVTGGGRCSCAPSYRAEVWSHREKKRIRNTFGSEAEAKEWRQDATVAVRKGAMRAPSPESVMTLQPAADKWLADARAGSIRNRSGDRYKPSVLRGYEQALRLRVLPVFGHVRLGDLRLVDLQVLVEELNKDTNASTVRNTIMPLRAIYRRAVSLGHVAVNPTAGLQLAAVRGRRTRIASPGEATALLEELAAGDRAIWATAMYAGLRYGELRALRFEDVDLAGGLIRVARSWDPREGEIEPKSTSGERRVPIAAVLRDHLVEQRMRVDWSAGLVFGREATLPFAHSSIVQRAERAWKAAGLDPIGLHECRHSFASLMIAAGVNAKALSTYMGHSSITLTFDLYGHLMPGDESEAAELLDQYLLHKGEQAAERARAAGQSRGSAHPAEAVLSGRERF